MTPISLRLNFVLTFLIVLISLMWITLIVCYGATKELSNIDLTVKVAGKVVNLDDTINLKLGDSVQLEVEALNPDGSVDDITTDPGTIYESNAEWILSVTKTGLVAAKLDTSYSVTIRDKNIGFVTIVYSDHSQEKAGLTSVMFEVIVRESDLILKSDKTTLGVGETAQLTVLEKLADVKTRDITNEREGIIFYTTSESMLVPEPDGRVTCIGTRGESEEVAIIGAIKGGESDSVEFKLLADGPGPSLEVVADKLVLREGESTQLSVYKTQPDGERHEVTSASTGTTYLTFHGSGKNDPRFLTIDDSGLASAADSLGNNRSRHIVVFVRNGSDVGWIKLKVVKDR